MRHFALLGLTSLFTLSINTHAASIDQAASHKEWVPAGMTLKVATEKNAKVFALLDKQKKQKRNFEPKVDSNIFLVDFVVNGTGKVGVPTNIVSFVGAYIMNNSNVEKNFLIETTYCTDFLFPDNCAVLADYLTIEANSELPLAHKLTIQYKFTAAGEYNPMTQTRITEIKDPSLEFEGPYSFNTASVGLLDISE